MKLKESRTNHVKYFVNWVLQKKNTSNANILICEIWAKKYMKIDFTKLIF